MNHRAGLALVVALLGTSVSPTLAQESAAVTGEAALVGDVAAGEKRYKRTCRQCHGPTAKGVSSYPKLVGHPVAYLVDRLEQYRAGEKIGPNTPLMAPQARKLSDQHIADLAAFIVSLSD